MDSLYRERLIEIYADKKHFGELKDKTHEINRENPSCDDNIAIELKVDGNKVVSARFHGKTCFVSTVATEILLSHIEGMSVDAVLKLKKEDMDKFIGGVISSARVGCELFPLDTLKLALKQERKNDLTGN